MPLRLSIDKLKRLDKDNFVILWVHFSRPNLLRLIKTFLMLFITVFTFIGLPVIDTYWSVLNDHIEQFNIDFTEEEERESSKNETKELESKIIQHQNSMLTFLFNQLTSTAYHDHTSSYSSLITEVTTPPPEKVYC